MTGAAGWGGTGPGGPAGAIGPAGPGDLGAAGAGLRVLAVDDEPPALDELAYLLRADRRVGRVHAAGDAADALRLLRDVDVDAVFLDIRMPGLDGMELARVLRRFARPPAVVFVTAYDDAAVDAFELGAVDYLRKPVRGERLAEAVRRVAAAAPAPPGSLPGPPPAAGAGAGVDDPAIPVELAGTTRMVRRSAVRWVEAQGDYARLHTADGAHLVRVPLSTLAQRWAEAGFVRIHRSYLVPLRGVRELRLTGAGYVVQVGGAELPVSRRHVRELRDRLVRDAKRDWRRG